MSDEVMSDPIPAGSYAVVVAETAIKVSRVGGRRYVATRCEVVGRTTYAGHTLYLNIVPGTYVCTSWLTGFGLNQLRCEEPLGHSLDEVRRNAVDPTHGGVDVVAAELVGCGAAVRVIVIEFRGRFVNQITNVLGS